MKKEGVENIKKSRRKKSGFLANFRSNHKILFTLILLFLLLLLIIGGFQLYNYVKFILGFDLTVRLSVDKNDLNLVNGQKSEVEFSVERISSILCNTQCEYEFIDLSNEIILKKDSFMPIQGVSKTISQEIIAPEKGEGQVIYAFDLTCRNLATVFCNTQSLNISRRTIVTLEYQLSEKQLNAKKEAEDQLFSAQNILAQVKNALIRIPQILAGNSFLITSEDYVLLNSASENLSSVLTENLLLWVEQDYDNIKSDNLAETLEESKTIIDSFDKNFNNNLLNYNSMISELISMTQSLENAANLNLDQGQSEKLEKIIVDFNQKVSQFSQKTSLNEKKVIFNSINLSLSEFENKGPKADYNFTKINLLNLTELNVNLDWKESSNASLPEPKKICCLKKICKSCEIQKKYPIIILHGHNFNEAISADNIINDFGKLQDKLESLGYLNAGELYLYEPTREKSGLLGTIINPIVVRQSYYFDFIQKPQGYKSIQIQSQNIDTYAVRLREIIENVKYETQSQKVIIIAHSMGGLVVRRYIQIFGKESLDRIILISSPNSGIIGSISKYCSAFGAVSECRDLDSESLFINKLNRENTFLPITYNVVGIGCEMDESDGDGVVLANNSLLKESDNIKNFFVSGACSGISFFHNSILDVNKYPELFSIIDKALADGS